MRINYSISRILSLFGLIVFSVSLTGCDDEVSVQDWFDTTEKIKITAKEQSEVRTPYGQSQHEAFKSYFNRLNELAVALKNEPELAEKLNMLMVQSDLVKVCTQVLFSRTDWQYLMMRCTKNRFFLCSEEVRSYPDIILSIRERLVPELQRRLDQTAACSRYYKASL